MIQKTYGQLRKEVLDVVDGHNEEILTDDELITLCNEAIADAESNILTLNEDYFLTSQKLYNGSSNGLISGQADYPLIFGANPTVEIYANKIREIIYDNGNPGDLYKVNPYRQGQDLAEIYDLNYSTGITDCSMRYMVYNKCPYDSTNKYTTGTQLKFIPTPQSSGDYITIWFIRQASRIPLASAGSLALSEAVYVDIPQFYEFIKAYMVYKYAVKDASPKLDIFVQDYGYWKQRMIDSLQNKVLDNNNSLLMADFSHYEEHI